MLQYKFTYTNYIQLLTLPGPITLTYWVAKENEVPPCRYSLGDSHKVENAKYLLQHMQVITLSLNRN